VVRIFRTLERYARVQIQKIKDNVASSSSRDGADPPTGWNTYTFIGGNPFSL